MPYRAPLADFHFLLDHVLCFADVAATPRFAEATPDLVAAILSEAAKLCETTLAPLNRAGDKHPAKLENGVSARPLALPKVLPPSRQVAGSACRPTLTMAALACPWP